MIPKASCDPKKVWGCPPWQPRLCRIYIRHCRRVRTCAITIITSLLGSTHSLAPTPASHSGVENQQSFDFVGQKVLVASRYYFGALVMRAETPMPVCKYDERTVESEVARVATSAFDDFSRSRYHKLWRIDVLRLVVSFLFRTAIRWINAHGTWYLVAGQQKLQRHLQLPPLVSAVVLPIKSSRPICMGSSCVMNAQTVAGAVRPFPNRSRKSLLFVRELLQSLGNVHANERKPQRNRQYKIDPPSHTASAWQAIGDSRDTGCHAQARAPPEPSYASLIYRKRLTMAATKRTFA
jgi:hypothetical protein